jgi:hypothetical protein
MKKNDPKTAWHEFTCLRPAWEAPSWTAWPSFPGSHDHQSIAREDYPQHLDLQVLVLRWVVSYHSIEVLGCRSTADKQGRET